MAKENEYVEEAVTRLFELSTDDIKRLEYEQREKALRDYNWQMKCAEKRGLEQGLERGSELHLKEQVRKKWLKGVSAVDIADALEEPIERIQEVLTKIENE